MVQARHLKRSIAHCFNGTAVSTREKRKSQIVQCVLLEMVPNVDGVATPVNAFSVQGS